jgi:hypothetical protein
MRFKPIIAAIIAFLFSLVVLGSVLAFFALALLGERNGESSPVQAETVFLSGGALLFVISTWFAFRIYRRVAAVIAGTFVKPVNEETTLKLRFWLAGYILGFAILFAGLWHLDIPLLVRHETTQGWITGISVEPFKGYRNQFHLYIAHYAYSDKDGVRYERRARASTIGYESQGDRFTVLYHPDNPKRHSVLTLWGQLISLGLICLGLLIGLGSAIKGRAIKARLHR